MMFSWTDRDLNTEQGNAVTADGSVLVIACPGSGKTRTLTYKIAYELSRTTSAREYVIAITYTHRAADEMRERIENLGIDTTNLWIGTIHAFCLEWIIKPYSIYQPELARGYRVIDLHEREKLLERLCSPYTAPKITFYDCEYYFVEDGYNLNCPNHGKHSSIQAILAEYFQILSTSRQIDFELILWYSYKLIQHNPSISGLLSKLFPIVLIDEYQDTKAIQYSIIGSILRAGRGATRLFMVGDPNQAIYGSLGGYPITIEALRELTQIPVDVLELSRNYRSSERIIQYFSNFNFYNTTIEAASENINYQSLITYNNTIIRENLVEEIVRVIRHNVETLGISPNELCVLAPQWMHLASVTRSLVVNMPEYQFDGPGMVPFARDIENFWYKLARIVLTEPSPTMYVRRLRWAEEILCELKDAGIDISMLSRKNFLRECNSILIAEENGLEFLRSFFDILFDRLRIPFHEYVLLEEHYQAFFASSQSRIERLESEGVGAIGELSFFKKVFQNRTGITISTIHGVKGAEFDVVIAFGLLQGMVPHFNETASDESAKKMLYVIGSRARKNLHLFSESGRPRGKYDTYQATEILAACTFNYDSL